MHIIDERLEPAIARIEGVMRSPASEALELFRSLDAPAAGEMSGEYVGCVHDGSDAEVRRAKAAFFFDQQAAGGAWLGKAYSSRAWTSDAPAEGEGEGEGYNRYQLADGTIIRHLRFSTLIGPSPLDGRPSLVMRYQSFRNAAGAIDLIDEVRRLTEYGYLGVYTADRAIDGFSPNKRAGSVRTDVEVLGLAGPIGGWRGVDDPSVELIGRRGGQR